MNLSPNSPSGPDARTSFSQGRIIELDGLRGMAIVFVLLFHYVADQGVWMDAGPSVAPGSFLYHFQRLFATGWADVDLFFVLSGFLIGVFC
jgi:peptidoglycan/LPS O-acetylase OafA/YrhL